MVLNCRWGSVHLGRNFGPPAIVLGASHIIYRHRCICPADKPHGQQGFRGNFWHQLQHCRDSSAFCNLLLFFLFMIISSIAVFSCRLLADGQWNQPQPSLPPGNAPQARPSSDEKCNSRPGSGRGCVFVLAVFFAPLVMN